MQSSERLRNEQVAQVVAEVTRLAQQREDVQLQSLERSQVEQILTELNLPKDLIDEAIAQLQRKESLAKEQRRKKLLIAGGAALLVFLLALSYWWISSRNAAFAKITADNARLTRQAEEGNLQTVTRDGQELFYRVTLRNVPAGERLELRCNWIDPSGKVFRESRWDTRVTDKSVWATQCKCQPGADAPKGAWKVEMIMDGRLLSSTNFQVE